LVEFSSAGRDVGLLLVVDVPEVAGACTVLVSSVEPVGVAVPVVVPLLEFEAEHELPLVPLHPPMAAAEVPVVEVVPVVEGEAAVEAVPVVPAVETRAVCANAAPLARPRASAAVM
jgi:hypothetical protein